ncbi:TPA: hypothetical protein DEP86_01550, partial [Candidatus Uhrbacteria bacterium]|nr:hypothetical protein [Candidatus Uhrbacteria bacterium]
MRHNETTGSYLMEQEQKVECEFHRSPAIKRLLARSLDVRAVRRKCMESAHLAIDSKYTSEGDRRGWQERLLSAEKELENMQSKLDEFIATAELLSEDDFDRQFGELRAELDGILTRLHGYEILPWWRDRDTDFPSFFRDIRTVETYREFMESKVMQWLPRKAEVGRILSIAREMHHRAGGDDAQPIRIVDVGGANGALGKLVVDLARKNGIGIEYTVVDPDDQIISQAQEAYGDEISFSVCSAGEFSEKVNSDDTEAAERMARRRALIEFNQRRFFDLGSIIDLMNDRLGNGEEIADDVISDFCLAWEEDFQPVPDSFLGPEGNETFKDWVEGSKLNDYRSLFSRWFDRQQQEIVRLTTLVEKRLSEIQSKFDLVINSWMPHDLDFSADL